MITGVGLENWAGRRIIFGRITALPALEALEKLGVFFATGEELTGDPLFRQLYVLL